jgi:hypothetical protein
MAEIEFTLMALTQLTRFLVLQQSGMPPPKNCALAFLLVEDLIADDWEVGPPASQLLGETEP